MAKLPPLVQNAIAAVVGAVAPLLPGLLADPAPTVTPRELARAAVSALCVVIALNFKTPTKPDA